MAPIRTVRDLPADMVGKFAIACGPHILVSGFDEFGNLLGAHQPSDIAAFATAGAAKDKALECARRNRNVFEVVTLAARPDPKPLVAKCCATCGSRNVTNDAIAKWNDVAQEWEILTLLQNADCEDCGGETTIEEQPLDEPPEGGLSAEQLAKLDQEDAANGIGHLAETQCADWPQCACGSGGPDHCDGRIDP